MSLGSFIMLINTKIKLYIVKYFFKVVKILKINLNIYKNTERKMKRNKKKI